MTTREKTIVDGILDAVLTQQGFEIEENTSSYYDPKFIFEALARYSPSQSKRVDVNTPEMKRAIAATYKIYAKKKGMPFLKTLKTLTAIRNALKMDKSAGLPFMGKKEDSFFYAIDREKQVRDKIKKAAPCLAMTRTQLGGKVRLVWAFPFEMTIIESRFAWPLIQHFLTANTTMAFGLTKFELGGIIDNIDHSYGVTCGLDFSKFDSTISADLIYLAFQILGTWFTEEEKKEYGWDLIVDYFIHTPIVMPNGRVYFGKKHGVPSGSFFTQLVDSVVNTIVQFYMAARLGYSISKWKFKVLGDDVIISIPAEVSLDNYERVVKEELGLIMNADKTKRYAHFLGATWINGIPYREKGEILQKMKYPERYRVYPEKDKVGKFVCANQIMLQYCSAYANAVNLLPYARWHPCDGDGLNQLPMTLVPTYERTGFKENVINIGWTEEGANISATSLLHERILC